MATIKSYEDLKVYQLSYTAAMDVFRATVKFPKHEMYSLTDQIRRSARSIPANIVEGWAKRNYENIFKKHLYDALGSEAETKLWLKFSLDCEYLDRDTYNHLRSQYDEIGKMLTSLIERWKTY